MKKTVVLTEEEKRSVRRMGGRVAGDPPIGIKTPHPSLDEVAAAIGLTPKERRETEELVARSRPAPKNRHS